MTYLELKEQQERRLDYLARLITMEPPCRHVHSRLFIEEMGELVKRINSLESREKFYKSLDFVSKLSCLTLVPVIFPWK